MINKQVIMSFEEYDELIQYKKNWEGNCSVLWVDQNGNKYYISTHSLINNMKTDMENYKTKIDSLKEFKHKILYDMEKEIREKDTKDNKWYIKFLSFVSNTFRL